MTAVPLVYDYKSCQLDANYSNYHALHAKTKPRKSTQKQKVCLGATVVGAICAVMILVKLSPVKIHWLQNPPAGQLGSKVEDNISATAFLHFERSQKVESSLQQNPGILVLDSATYLQVLGFSSTQGFCTTSSTNARGQTQIHLEINVNTEVGVYPRRMVGGTQDPQFSKLRSALFFKSWKIGSSARCCLSWSCLK